VRARRIARREGKEVSSAKREIVAREQSEQIRYKEIYGIDLQDTSVFDFVIDSGEKSPDEIVATLAARVPR
jgi:cytidylate kinase